MGRRMDIKEYVLLCRENATSPKPKRVLCDGIEFYPYAYNLSFARDGTPIHSAVMIESRGEFLYRYEVDKVLFLG